MCSTLIEVNNKYNSCGDDVGGGGAQKLQTFPRIFPFSPHRDHWRKISIQFSAVKWKLERDNMFTIETEQCIAFREEVVDAYQVLNKELSWSDLLKFK